MNALSFAEPFESLPEPELQIVEDAPLAVDDHLDEEALARWEDDGGSIVDVG